jgi:hypothetical protein
MNIVNFKIRTALSLLFVLSISACAAQLKSSVDIAEQAEFGELKTYAWISDQPMFASNAAAPEVVNPLNEQRIRTAVEDQLQNKGYRKVSIDQADFVVAFTLGARERVRIQQHYNDFGYNYYGYHHGFNRFSRFGRGFGGFGSSVSVRTFTEGTLVVDIFENTEKEAIWHGSATKRLSGDGATLELIDEAVTTLLAEFPDRDAMFEVTETVTS